jgi:transketolase
MNDRPKMMQRAAFGNALLELGEGNPRLVVLDADISSSLYTSQFAKKFPDRHINFGVAEQNMVIGAAGLATTGLIPLACTYATFATLRACEQIRSFICYARLNVKIVCSHGGIEVGWDGPTHQATEDVAVMRPMPNMTVVVPADAVATAALIRQAVDHVGPLYFRMGRNPTPVIYEDSQPFTLGKAVQLREGRDVTLVAMGVMVSIALDAAELLTQRGIQARLLDMHTVKPLDGEALLAAASDTCLIVTLEDHNVIGGLGAAVAEFVSTHRPAPVLRIGVPDVFAESGEPSLLFNKYAMDAQSVSARVEKAFKEWCDRGGAFMETNALSLGDE